jgi:hypothetical protein
MARALETVEENGGVRRGPTAELEELRLRETRLQGELMRSEDRYRGRYVSCPRA